MSIKECSAAEYIRAHLRDFMSDGQVVTKPEMKKYVESVGGRSITEGELTGAVRDLIAKEPAYVKVSRGNYQYIGNQRHSFKIGVNVILKDTILDLKNLSESINILEASIEDLEVAKEVRKIISKIEDLIL